MKKQLKVGFDLDGVLLYNPARIIRFPVTMLKRILLRKKRLKFYSPKSRLEKMIWRMFHWSSIYIAPGLDEIKRLSENGKIEAYIITARYSFLQKDFRHWLSKMKIANSFTDVYQNMDDEQPHLFKEKMIKKLGLDVFVEDNYDIVKHLTKKTGAKIYWIYNILDRMIEHPHKFPTLKKTVEHIKKNI